MKYFKILLVSLVLCVSNVLIHPLTHAQTTCPVLPTDTGSVISTVTLETTTTYTIWSRLLAPDTTNNSYYLQVDNQCAIKIGDGTIPANTWTWINYKDGNSTSLNNLSLTAGDHIIKLIGAEPNVGVDRLLFLRDPNCIPSGVGDNCAIAPTATTVPLTPTNTPVPTQMIPTATPVIPTATPTPKPLPTATPISDKIPPTIFITYPFNGNKVDRKSTVTITAEAADASGISKVEFYVNNSLKCTDTSADYSCAFQTYAQKNISYTITVKAYDRYANVASNSTSISSQ